MNKKIALYPLKFKPILKEKVWGGDKLYHLFGKNQLKNTGESWELSGVENNISLVANGLLQGVTLSKIIETYKAELLGDKVYSKFGDKFPLLFKFIDANQDLSVQLHPDDLLAKERHNSFGKTEMWYVLHAEKDARLILGFNKEMDEEAYLKKLRENKLTEILQSVLVKEGDSFFIEPGTVHAIGAGIVLAEIQQTSDITYRLYDWDRPDIDGNYRELHTDQALKAINFNHTNSRLIYSKEKNEAVQLCSTPYFETNQLILTKCLERDYSMLDSFVVYMCVEGELVVKTTHFSEIIKKGETILIPSSIKKINLLTDSATILEVYIP